MSAASAPPVAERLPRSAAARRALLTVVFLGGLLALGFLFSGSAHADSGTPLSGPGGGTKDTGPTAASLLRSGGEEALGGTGDQGEGDRSNGGQDNGDQGDARTTAQSAAESTGQAAVRTAGAAHDATRQATGTAQAAPEPAAPAVPVSGGSASREAASDTAARGTAEAARAAAAAETVVEPVAEGAKHAHRATTRPVGEAVQTVEGVTGRAGLGELTGRLLPLHPGDRLGGTPGTGGTGAAGEHRTGEGSGGDDGHGGTASGLHGPGDTTGTQPAPDPAWHGGDRHATSGDGPYGEDGDDDRGPFPFRHLPATPATAPSSGQSAGEGHGPRGGADQLAAYVTDLERHALLRPGAVRAEHTAPIRDRAGDILEFPG